MRTKFHNSLLFRLLSFAVVLIVLTWAIAAHTLIREYRVYRIARNVVSVNEMVDAVLQAGQNLAFERGRTNVMLNSPDPASASNIEFISVRRKIADEWLRPLLGDADFLAIPLGSHIAGEYARLTALRTEIDSAIAMPRDRRDASLQRRWVPEVSHLITDIGDLVTALSFSPEGYGVSFRNLSRMKYLAFGLRNCAGVEATTIAASLSAENRISPSDLERVLTLRGEASALWGALGKESSLFGNRRILDAIDQIDQRFFIDFRERQNVVLAALREGALSPVSSAELTAASVPALDSMAALMTVLSEETEVEVHALEASTRVSFLYSSMIGLIAFVSGLLTAHVLFFRLIRPMRRIGTQLHALAKGDVGTEIRPMGKNDEISDMSEAVIVFHDSLVERKALEDQLRILSNSDGLTGLTNRRGLDDSLADEWSRSLRNGLPVAIAMFDVDFFKKFNDRYGHLGGDACLKEIARVLGEHTRRPGDVAARFGGEEFLVLLPGLTAEECRDWAEHVRKDIETLAIPHADSPTGYVTVSCGAASVIPRQDLATLDLIRLADGHLYRAKEEGRNRVVS